MLCLLVIAASSTALQSGDFTYTSSGGEITILGYTGAGGDIMIPDMITGLPVTSIQDFAFLETSSLTGVTIPGSVISTGFAAFSDCISLTNVTILDGVTFIEDSTFDGCSSLSSVTIPDSVTSIGDATFNGCSSLKSVTIPDQVSSIGERAFMLCSSLTNIMVDALNTSYSSSNGVLFNKSMSTLVQYPGGKIGSYTIPSSVTSIEPSAFRACSNLISITLPESIISIGGYAFSSCNGLTSITIPDQIISIESSTFSDCNSLASVTIPESVISIQSLAFGYCSSLTSVYMKGNAPSLNVFGNFTGTPNAVIYYVPGTTGWSATFGGRPTVLWNPLIQTDDGSFGVQASGFGFNITESVSGLVVVEACANLTEGIWVSVETNTMNNASVYFSDPHWTNHPNRYYRLSMP